MPTLLHPTGVTPAHISAVIRAVTSFYAPFLTPMTMTDGTVVPPMYDTKDLCGIIGMGQHDLPVVCWENGPTGWAQEVLDGNLTEEMRVTMSNMGLAVAPRHPAVFPVGIHAEPTTAYSLSLTIDPTVPKPPKTLPAGTTSGAWKLTRETVPAGTTVGVWKFGCGSCIDRYWATPAGLLIQSGQRTALTQWIWNPAVTREKIVLHVTKREAQGYVLLGKPATINLPADLTRLPNKHPDRTSDPAGAGISAKLRADLRIALEDAIFKSY